MNNSMRKGYGTRGHGVKGQEIRDIALRLIRAQRKVEFDTEDQVLYISIILHVGKILHVGIILHVSIVSYLG